MHLLASYRSGSMRALPKNLPAGLYEAASRRGAPLRPLSGGQAASAIPRQFSGPTTPRTSSPLASRPPAAPVQPQIQPQSTGGWAVSPQEKTQYDTQFAKLDTQNLGFVTGDQAAAFFGNSHLPEDDLAQIWDLADMRSEGQLNRDEFAIAMYLIRSQLSRRGPIPKTLPSNLVPPSVRQIQTASTPASPPKSKTAADDLFGLDALSDAPTQAPQSTGGSGSAFPQPSAPLQPVALPSASQLSQSSQSTFFKPFVPTSSFGQSVVSPQATGTSASSSVARQLPLQQQSQHASVNEDLLGDTDPEVSKRLTNETTELANLSNQVGNLATQMQEVKTKNTTVDSNMSAAAAQKRDFETRLAQLRTAYEKEARDLRTKEDRLIGVQNEAKKLQADLVMAEHSFIAMQEKKQQIEQSLAAQQQEIAGYKEQLRDINAKVAQIRPELEKAESSLRQQKGLNAITKKQVSTAEAEYQRLHEQLDGLTRDNEEAIREAKELDETQRNLQSRQSSASVPVASPAPSTTSQSTNPFFRRQTTSMSDRNAARSPLAQELVRTPNHYAFDSFFDSTFSAPEGPSVAPTTSISNATAAGPSDIAANETPASDAEVRSPSTPLQLSRGDLPSSGQIPPPPPQSRQITSSFLPLKESAQRSSSPSSSVGVAPPQSRFGDESGYNTPVQERQASLATIHSAADPATAAVLSPLSQSHEAGESSAPAEESQVIPGSFPGDNSPPTEVEPKAVASSAVDDDPFAIPNSTRSPAAKDDFDSAFAGFEDNGKAPASSDAFEEPPKAHKDEFPPIQEFDDDSDSDSDSGKGFEDDFTSTAPAAAAATDQASATGVAAGSLPLASPAAESSAMASERPDVLRGVSSATQLPTPGAQQSPPTYDQTISNEDRARGGSNQFPSEYGGLLPSREDPISPETAVESPVQQTSASIAPIESHASKSAELPAPAIAPSAVTSATVQSTPAKHKDAFDAFDDEFGELSESNVVEDKGDEELGVSQHTDFGDDFNPTFDSPAPSKMTASSAFGVERGAFDNFESSVSAAGQASGSSAAPSGAANNQDWDSMFAGLSKEGGMPRQTNGKSSVTAAADEFFGNSTGSNGASSSLAPPEPSTKRPPLGRAITEGTEHDDPILKRLTSMGYPRDQSLRALEKFDYNIDKVGSED